MTEGVRPSPDLVARARRYTLDDITLELRQNGESAVRELRQVLGDLYFEEGGSSTPAPVRLEVLWGQGTFLAPGGARELFCKDGLRGLETPLGMVLTDGESVLDVRSEQALCIASLAPTFATKPLLLKRNFWAYALMKLLRTRGAQCLHAAGLVSASGEGLVIAGPSGSGKSTLAIGLVRAGWGYLSDDALLLRQERGAVYARALRRAFYVDGSAADRYGDLQIGAEQSDATGGTRRQIGVGAAFPNQFIARCTPRTLIFPRIVDSAKSTLQPIERTEALGRLLSASGPQLFDRHTMGGQLQVLSGLLAQAPSYELQAGRDLYQRPARLSDLLETIRCAAPATA